MVKIVPKIYTSSMEAPTSKQMLQVVEDDEYTITPESSPKYASYLRCLNFITCCTTFGLYPCPLCFSHKVAKNTTVRLTNETLEYQEASTDFCCNISKRKANIPIETITDVSVTTGCCLSLFGLKQLDVATISNPFSEARICQLKDPEGFRAAILEARKRHKDKEMTVVVKKETNPITKIKEAKELFDMGILTESEYDQVRGAVMNTEEFQAEKKKLMDAFLRS